eukprot:9035241-Pyramimonas_sp.AAC.1
MDTCWHPHTVPEARMPTPVDGQAWASRPPLGRCLAYQHCGPLARPCVGQLPLRARPRLTLTVPSR